MQPFRTHRGLVAVLDRINVDTDQIIPKQFLKRIVRTGFGPFLFYDWRFLEDGSPDPEFELNQKQFQGATILLTGSNFGCGSSREHAPWALQDHGFRVLIASSFADIFFSNCFKNGLLPVAVAEDTVTQLRDAALANPGYEIEVNLESQTIQGDLSLNFGFEIDPFRKKCLLQGIDDVGLTLQLEDRIREYEAGRPSFRTFGS